MSSCFFAHHAAASATVEPPVTLVMSAKASSFVRYLLFLKSSAMSTPVMALMPSTANDEQSFVPHANGAWALSMRKLWYPTESQFLSRFIKAPTRARCRQALRHVGTQSHPGSNSSDRPMCNGDWKPAVD